MYQWAQRYKKDFAGEVIIRQGMSTFKSVINVTPSMKKPKLTQHQMEQCILELESKLKQEQMRSTVLDKMVEITEQELKISDRKNLWPNSPSSQGASS